MSSIRRCKYCASTAVEEDRARGDIVCMNCGSVLESDIVVSDTQYEEGACGTSHVRGHFVAADKKGPAWAHLSFIGEHLNPRELSLRAAKKEITQLCNQLQLKPHCFDVAFHFFKMALNEKFTQGRKSTHVYAACVYLACRTEGTSHLLVDVSIASQICGYELGRTYLKMLEAIPVHIPPVDPCIYILRFATRLDFGWKTQLVINTALRIIQRMQRDYIDSGRRPSGVCGAALLLAARFHDLPCSVENVASVVNVHEQTLMKRLAEFANTPSSELLLTEFMTTDLEKGQDPPSFTAARNSEEEVPETKRAKVRPEEIEAMLNKLARRACEKQKNYKNE